MAFIRFNNGQPDKTIDAETAADIWAVLKGESDGTPEQQRFCETIDKIYLNWRNAPDSYIKENFDIIAPMAMGRWMCDRYGNLTRPEPSDEFGKAFGEKWGLLKNGWITELGKKHAGQGPKYWSNET